MEMKEFLKGFAEQFDDLEEEVTPETEFQELEDWSSLTAMGIIAFAKTAYGKTVTGREVRSCKTAEELFNLINNK